LKSVAEGKVLGDPIGIGGVHEFGGAEVAAAFGVFGGQQVAATGAGTHDFAGAGDFEPFGDRFPSFDTFGASHKFTFNLYKRARTIERAGRRIKRYFEIFGALK
jgi:hypothetical protein